MIGPPVHVDEIDDRARDDPIDQVPGGAPDDEREARAGNDLMVREARRVHPDADERCDRDDRDDRRLERELGDIQDPEGSAAVPHVREVHQTGHDGDARMQRHVRPDDRFGQLIERDDGERQPDFEPARRLILPGNHPFAHSFSHASAFSTARGAPPPRASKTLIIARGAPPPLAQGRRRWARA